MKAQIRIYTLSLALCFVGVLQAQTGKFYSTSNGLSSTLINQIYQDNRGFIWTATEYGLNKFDGLRFSIYKYQPGDSTSLKNNYVRTLYEDNRGHLLVGCIDGLMRYNPETDTFHEVPMYRTGKRVYPHVTQMRRLRDGELWIVTSGQGIFKLDEQTGRATSIDILMQQIHNNFLSNLYEDSFNNVWIGSNGGLFCYQPATGKVRVYKVPLIRDNYILSILEDKQGNLFVGLEKHGLCRYDRLADRFVTIPSDDDAGDISVYTLALVNDRLLVGTDGQGMKTYNYQTGMLQDYLLNEAPVDFTQGKIHVILEDRDKNLWLGLFQKGIALLPKKETPFGYYGAKSLHYNPIGQGCVMSVYQDSRRHLWVGADSEGLYELNANGQRLRHYRPEQGENSVPGTILCMYEDSQDNFWLGSYTRGLGRLNRTTGLCDYPLPINNERIYSITEDRDKNLYIATLGSGFYRYNLLTRELTHYESAKDESGDLTRNALSNDYINHVFCDSDGLIWLAHYKGISCFNPMTESFINYNGVNTLIVDHVAYVLQEDYAGNIWAGTTDGLYRFDKQNNVLTRYSTAEGLPNNVICGICEDHGHNLWVSTYMGISKYDRAGRRFVNYYAGDGLQGNEFTHGAYFIDSSGMVYFGGTEGITLFRPEAIKATSKEAPVLITDFFIFDRPVRRDTRSGGEPVVYQSVPDADYFQLAHGDNTFSIVFSNLQYDNPEQTTYQYRIDELAARWITTEPGVNSVTYNNLLPGKYTFHVRAVSHGNYSPTRTVKIIIAPPWYEMWWAYVIYIALIVLLIAGVVNNILSRMRHKREILEREHAEQLGEAKLQFFINISHEIRTPMTLIINPLEKLIAQTPEGELQKTYLMIYRNAQRILRLINQLMDIRKLDKGQMQMTFRETDMVGFIDDIVLTFNYPATKKQIALTFVHAMPQLSVWIDLNNFDKILMNILSNALKYTPEKGDITIALTTGHDDDRTDALRDYCEISVTDSGIGIEKERIERIFERFYQIDNDVTQSNFGTGIGLHLSRSLVELHHGTLFAENREDASGSRFVIRIPLGVAHLNTDELGNASTPVVHHPAMILQEQDVLLVDETPSDDSIVPPPYVRPRSSKHILVVEDEPEVRDYICEELKRDYFVATADNGKEAYDKILKKAPDLIISDVMMPVMDGLQLCLKIKRNSHVNHIPIILLTAKSRPEDTLEGMAIGADAYISKPFNTEILKSTIANLLTNRSLLKSTFSGAQQQEDKVQKMDIVSSDEVLMEKIMKVVNDNLNSPNLGVALLATEVGLSRVHVHRKLKEFTNLSPRNFIRNIRLHQAAKLLEENDLTVSEAAYATGFTNLSHFTACFKELFGVSPKEYKAGKRGDEIKKPF